MHLQSFSVQGFANLTEPVVLSDLQDLNVVYGPNQIGKSTLLRAVSLYFALLGAGETITRSQPQNLDWETGDLKSFEHVAFPWTEPGLMRFDVTWRIRSRDLERYGLIPETACDTLRTVVEFKQVSRSLELRVASWKANDEELATLDRMGKTGGVVAFGQQLRRLLADARPFAQEQPILPFRFLGGGSEPVPQMLRDALFDARQSVAPEGRKRWDLFAQTAGDFREELGPGAWGTTFDRKSARADLVWIHEEKATPLERMSAGVQRLIGLGAEMALAFEPILFMEEPEWRLSPLFQTRMADIARRTIQAKLGPRQFFLSTHSPSLAAQGTAYAMERGEQGVVVFQKPWEAEAAMAASGSAADGPADLGSLIGLVEDLAELEETDLVAAPAAAPSAPPVPAPGAAPWQPPRPGGLPSVPGVPAAPTAAPGQAGWQPRPGVVPAGAGVAAPTGQAPWQLGQPRG